MYKAFFIVLFGFFASLLYAAERRITTNSASDTFPVYSPDGQYIAFLSDRDAISHIYIVDLSNSNIRRLTISNIGEEDTPAWSPDMSTIAFSVSNDIYLVDINGSNIRYLTSGLYPDFSPDGRYIAFEDDMYGSKDIFIIGIDGSGRKRITAYTNDESIPTWSSNGEYIYFNSSINGVDGRYRINTNGSGLEFISTEYENKHSSFSPDKTKIAAYKSYTSGNLDIYVYDNPALNLPICYITYPVYMQVVSNTIEIRGSATSNVGYDGSLLCSFIRYVLTYSNIDTGKSGGITNSYEAVYNDTLAMWDSKNADGIYDIKLAVEGNNITGNVWAYDIVRVVISNGRVSMVSNLTASPISSGRIYLQWDKVPDIDVSYYLIYYDGGYTNTSPGVSIILATNTNNTYITTNLVDGMIYDFAVYGVDTAGYYSPISQVATATADASPPLNITNYYSPTHIIESITTNRVVTINFDDAFDYNSLLQTEGSGLLGYSYIWSLNSSDIPPQLTNTNFVSRGVETITSPPLGSGGWYLILRSVDKAGNWKEDNLDVFGPYMINAYYSDTIINYPNPFLARVEYTTILYHLESDTKVDLYIYALSGQEVLHRTFTPGDIGGRAGMNWYIWDGMDNNGNYVEEGSYICIVRAGDIKFVRKIGVLN